MAQVKATSNFNDSVNFLTSLSSSNETVQVVHLRAVMRAWMGRLLGRLHAGLLLALLLSAGSAGACQAGACISAGPVLAQVDSKQGILLNALLGGLLGTSVNLTVLDWNAIAQNDVSILSYFQAVQSNAQLSNTNDVLNTQLTLLQLIKAAADVAQADGNTAAVSALSALNLNLPALTTPILLGDLFKLTFPVGALTDARINLLDLLTGFIQLYNYKNVLTTPAPITLTTSSLASLGLGGLVQNVQLYLQVVEPPVFICAPTQTTFHTAAIRIKLNLSLVNQSLDTTALTGALSGLGTVSTSLSLTDLSLYAEVARADGSLDAVDALAQTVTLTAHPGVVDLYLGSLPDALFYNRVRAVNPATDLDFGTVGSLHIVVKIPIIGTTLADVTTNVQLKSAAQGANASASTVTVSGPFPKVVRFTSSSVSAANLIASLVASLEIRVQGTLGPLLDPLVNGTVLPIIKPLVANAVAPLLGSVLAGLVDPLLDLLGIKIGEAVVQVNGVSQICVQFDLGKAVRNVSRNETFAVANTAKPGDELEYCLNYNNSGFVPAQNVVLRDPLPGGLTPLLSVPSYGGQALLLNGVGLSAASDTDQGEWQGSNLTVRVGTVPGKQSGQLCFRAMMN